MRAIERLGWTVIPIDIVPERKRSAASRLLGRITHRLGYPLDWPGVNEQIIREARVARPEIVWVDKGLTVRPQTYAWLKHNAGRCTIVGYSPDDMGAPHNQSHNFRQSIGYFDYFFTTKTYNVAELKAMGARRPIFIGNAFDPELHRPLQLSQFDKAALGGPVGFIGAWEPDRAELMLAVARAGVPVRWWGCGIELPRRFRHPNLSANPKCLWGEQYAKAINAFDINLCFLRKINRDRQTTRSVEIPACGAFMLGERTDEHLGLFNEGTEAEFFASSGELLDKIRRYLAEPAERMNIAAAGRLRCIRSGYSNDERMKKMMRIISTERHKPTWSHSPTQCVGQ